MLTLDMKNMKARNMEELSKNLQEIADSIKEGYKAGIMRPQCIWNVKGTEEQDEAEKERVFHFSFKADVWIKAKCLDAAVDYFESIGLLSSDALELGGEVSDEYEVEECKEV